MHEDPLFAPDAGAVVENWVFGELMKALPWPAPIRYWRSLSGAEVDFVVDTPGALLGIEVKTGAMRTPALSRSSRSFIKAYSPPQFWVVNRSLDTTREDGGTVIRWVPLHLLSERLAEYRSDLTM